MRDVGLVAAFSVMVLMDLVGNTMVILVILLNKSMKTPMNRLLLNLAVADVTVAIFTALQFVLGPFYQHPTGSTGALLCKFITGGPMIWTAALVSICNLVAISYERWEKVSSEASPKYSACSNYLSASHQLNPPDISTYQPVTNLLAKLLTHLSTYPPIFRPSNLRWVTKVMTRSTTPWNLSVTPVYLPHSSPSFQCCLRLTKWSLISCNLFGGKAGLSSNLKEINHNISVYHVEWGVSPPIKGIKARQLLLPPILDTHRTYLTIYLLPYLMPTHAAILSIGYLPPYYLHVLC